ncbi:MAG: CsiV family protein [Pseudohongiellaceae bacterium]
MNIRQAGYRVLLLFLFSASGWAQQPEQRWVVVEVSIFSNELEVDRREELFSPEQFNPGYPSSIRRLDRVEELLVLPDYLAGPVVPYPAPDGFRYPDFPRRAYLQMPYSASDFQQTNRALERDAEHRLLFHGLWRQPLVALGDASAVFVEGGIDYGVHSELEGSLAVGLNNNRTRIVADANVWLLGFGVNDGDSGADEGWYLPPRPASVFNAIAVALANAAGGAGSDSYSDSTPGYVSLSGSGSGSGSNPTPIQPSVVYHLKQQRLMRSEEFHYLDHPALGLVIQVTPYELPPLPTSSQEQ